jgi:hypothetical protein
MTVSLLLQPERAARLLEYHAADPRYPALDDVVDELFKTSWRAPAAAGTKQEIRRVVDNVVLYNLMSLAANAQAENQVRGIALLKLQELKQFLSDRIKTTADENQKAHYAFAIAAIRQFEEKPEQPTITKPLDPPDGPPI